MYLKSLELQGFKSFPDKTKLTFGAGTTVIVGPNGSGKSNISDAMRWVLGEISSKNLRGTRMGDIIFGGADSRKPMGYAEVSVTFDNRDPENRLECMYDEVTVTRRYYRSGDSEYYINRQAVRLKDIYELFMNTGVGRDGYSIIGQGKIAEIISRKSDERRSIFEDASGIAKYRHKKTETERKLADTEDNMTRINDVFLEVAAQVGPLEKEAEKASRAIELLETKKRVDVQLWLYDTEKLQSEIAEAEDNFNRSSFDLTTVNDTIASYETQNERLFDISQNNKYASEQLLARISAQTKINHELDSEYQVSKTNLSHTAELMEGAAEVIGEYEKAIEDESRGLENRRTRVTELEEQLALRQEAHKNAQEEQRKLRAEAEALETKIAEALTDIRAYEKEATDIRVRLSVIENAKSDDDGKNSTTLEEIAKYEQLATELGEKIAKTESSISSYDARLAEVNEAIASGKETLEDKYGERRELEEDYAAKKLASDSAKQRIDTFRAMEEQFEGYSNSVRYVMKAYSEGKITDRSGARCGKIYGPLTQVIRVEDRYVTAIETALAANLQHIVVENEETAKNAMFALKKAEAGRATFFPITSMKGQEPTHEMEESRGFRGFISFADELVTCDDKFREIVSSLLGRTVVFDNIDNATEMAKSLRYKVRAVTLDGQQINVGGSFTGGAFKQKNGILSRAGEIKRLEKELSDFSAVVSDLEVNLKDTEKNVIEAEDKKISLEDRRSLISVMQNNEILQLEQIRAKLDANNTLITKLTDDLNLINETAARCDDDLAVLSENEKSLRKQINEISDYRHEKDVERNALDDHREEVSLKCTELYIKINDVQKDIETENTLKDNSRDHIEACISEILVYKEKIDGYLVQIKDLKEANEANRINAGSGNEALEKLNQERAQLEENSMEFERRRNAINAKIREKMSQKELVYREYTKLENKLAQLRADQDKLVSKLWDEHELTRAEAVDLGYPMIDAKTRPEVAAKQTECRNRLRSLGNVDLDAVNKYNEIKSRYDYMKEQIRDLTEAKNDLEDIIERLEKEMKTAFITAFNNINENFNRVFSELFGGGSAELSLTDPEDVLTSGIEIKAAPPGKIIKSLMQLSGGEQAFVATALFFAILQVNPTPFCILDEIEAALDEVNVVRFAQYIKRYSKETQFVLITHRRGTMEAANRLYGVTMPEHGISKVLALDVGEISKAKGENWDGIFG